MSRALFLTRRMQLGYGVDLVVHEVCRRLRRRGHDVAVLCLESDSTFSGGYEIRRLARGTEREVLELGEGYRPDVVCASSSPFFEMLPVLRHRFSCWAWEHGDPTPELFPVDGEEREKIKRFKIEFCYPVLDGVIAISEFIRRDIEWPAAHVVYDGCDHAPDRGSKGLQDVGPSRDRPLRIGTLMRLGSGEARYKGNELFVELAQALQGTELSAEFHVMGRGTERDAAAFEGAGLRVHLNASDEEKWEYLRSLDVFVSCSLWEGFNLPLIEAQASGTMAMAFDTGAHPEVCPLVFSDLGEMAAFLVGVGGDPGLLLRHSRAGYHFVRRSFRWEHTAERFEELALAGGAPARRQGDSPSRMTGPSGSEPKGQATARATGLKRDVAAALRSLRLYGWRVTASKVRRHVREAGHRRR